MDDKTERWLPVTGNRVGVGDHTGAPWVGIGSQLRTGTRPGAAAGRPPLGRKTRGPFSHVEDQISIEPAFSRCH